MPLLKEAQILLLLTISKSGDGGHSGDILDTLATYTEV
jgi:hypothetical protein